MLFISIIIGIVLFVQLFKRVDALEKKVRELQGGSVKASQPVQQPAPQPQPMAQPVVTPPSVQAQPIAAPKPKQDGATEFAVGSKLLTGVGVFALILGVSFFLRYAFANNLISEEMRIILGVIFGLVIIIVGHLLRNKYAQYGHTLIGAGLGILYLSAYAAYSFYALIGLMPAFICLLIITAGGVWLSLSYNSKPLVTYAFLGAYIIPLILPLASSVHVLFMYLLILNVAVLLVARFKIWPEFTLGSLAGTCLIFLQWVFGPYNSSLELPTITYFTIIFFVYFITSLLNFVYRDRDYKGIDGILLYGIPTVYFLLMLTIVHGKQDVALLALLIGIFYVVLSCIIRAAFGQLGELKKFSNAMLCVAAVFIAAATALHFEGATITIFWAIEAVLMVSLGYMLNTPSNRMAGVALAGLTGLRALFYDLGTPQNAEAIFNSRSATLFFVVMGFFIIWRLYVSFIPKLEGIKPDEVRSARLVSAFGLYAGLFFWVTLEAHDFMTNYQLYISLIWMILAAVMLSLGAIFKERMLRVLSYILILIAWFMELIFHSSLPAGSPFILNVRVGTVIVAVGLCAYVLWLFKMDKENFSEEEKHLTVTMLLLTNGLVLWAGSLEILSYFNVQNGGRGMENIKRVALSGYWLLYALIGLGVGIMRKSIFVRYASIILFAVTIFKIFLYDTANLSDVYRFVSFITLGVILLIAGFAYYKFKDRILEFVNVGDNHKEVV